MGLLVISVSHWPEDCKWIAENLVHIWGENQST